MHRLLLIGLLAACGGASSTSTSPSPPAQRPAPSPDDGACGPLDEATCGATAGCYQQYEVIMTAYNARQRGGAVTAWFSRCRLGSQVSCTEPILCDEPDPACEAAGLRIHTASGCHDGCVRASVCQP